EIKNSLWLIKSKVGMSPIEFESFATSPAIKGEGRKFTSLPKSEGKTFLMIFEKIFLGKSSFIIGIIIYYI
ncbi:MAG: hypothetical protein ACYDEE_18620, partial [Ignavibacteriaceae bacterium]